MNKDTISMVVLGESQSGKTTLIRTFMEHSMPPEVPPVLPSITFTPSSNPDGVKTRIYDTSSEEAEELARLVALADVLMLCYRVLPRNVQGDDRASVVEAVNANIRKWLQRIRSLRGGKPPPVILVGVGIDERLEELGYVEGQMFGVEEEAAMMEMLENPALQDEVAPLMSEFPEIESVVEVSNLLTINVEGAFVSAHKAVLYSLTPLWNAESRRLTPMFEDRLTRIFNLMDADRDGILSDREQNAFQRHVFGSELNSDDLAGVRKLVSGHDPSWVVDDRGILLEGFIYLHQVYIERNEEEVPWTVLYAYGYDNELRLPEEFLVPPEYEFVVSADDVEGPDRYVSQLSSFALKWTERIFNRYANSAKSLELEDVEAMFHLCELEPEVSCPWDIQRVRSGHTVPLNTDGTLSLGSFQALWQLLLGSGSLEGARTCVRAATWLGYLHTVDDQQEALFVSWKYAPLRADRNLFRVLVMGDSGACKAWVTRGVLLGQEGPVAPIKDEEESQVCVSVEDFFVFASTVSPESLASANYSDVLVLVYTNSQASFAHLRAIGDALCASEMRATLPPLLVHGMTETGAADNSMREVASAYCRSRGIPLPLTASGVEKPSAADAEERAALTLRIKEASYHPSQYAMDKNSSWKIVVGVLALVGIAGAGAYLYVQHKNDE